MFEEFEYPAFFEHSQEEGVECCEAVVFIFAVYGFPFHVAVFVCSDSSDFGL